MNGKKEKTLDITTIKPGVIMLVETLGDLVYEFVKGDTPLTATASGGRGQFSDTKITFVTRKIKRNFPINIKVVAADNQIIIISTKEVVSLKLIAPTYSIEIWEDSINENFGPG